MDSMYDTIMGLPLFAGASHEKISEVIGKYKFHFLKYTEGQTIVTAGETCTHLKCIISGSVGLTALTSCSSVATKICTPYSACRASR